MMTIYSSFQYVRYGKAMCITQNVSYNYAYNKNNNNTNSILAWVLTFCCSIGLPFALRLNVTENTVKLNSNVSLSSN